MLRCNLAVLMAERGLKITKVSQDTGISRTTLTSLANNLALGIQFETMNTLCNYFKIFPSDLFLHINMDIKVLGYEGAPDNFVVNLEVGGEGSTYPQTFSGSIIDLNRRENFSGKMYDLHVMLEHMTSPDASYDHYGVDLESLPPAFRTDIEEKITKLAKECAEKYWGTKYGKAILLTIRAM